MSLAFATSYDSSTRLSAVFTPCPPGPPDRENRYLSSLSQTVSDREMTRSSTASLWRAG
jgi:hypothetical protein